MKIAIIHDRLVEYGGAERVLQSIVNIFPDADIYIRLLLIEKLQEISFLREL